MPFGYSICFVERGADRVVEWNPDTGDTKVLAGGRNPQDPTQELKSPYDLAVDGGGALLVSDKLNHRICRVQQGNVAPIPLQDKTKHRVRKPNSPPRFNPDLLYSPTSLVLEQGGTLLAGFYDDNTIYRIQRDGGLELVLGVLLDRPRFIDAPDETIAPGKVSECPVRGPVGIVERKDRTIFYIERRIQIVREYHPSRGIRSLFPLSRVWEWRTKDSAPERGRMSDYHPSYPSSLALDASERLHLCDPMHRCILRLDTAKGNFERVVERPRSSGAPRDSGVTAVAFGPDGTAWVADSGTQTIEGYSVGTGGAWTPNGTILQGVEKDRLRLLTGGMGLLARA